MNHSILLVFLLSDDSANSDDLAEITEFDNDKSNEYSSDKEYTFGFFS